MRRGPAKSTRWVLVATLLTAVVKSSFAGTPLVPMETRRSLARTCLHKALGETEAIADEERRGVVRSFVAEVQAQAGDVPGALAIAGNIAQAEIRAKTLDAIAARQAEAEARAGDIPAALRRTEGIRDLSWNCTALNAIAVAQMRAGDLPAAFRTADSITMNDLFRDMAVGEIAQEQGKLGDVPTALHTVERIHDDQEHAATLGVLASLRMDADDLPAALWMVSLVRKDGLKNYPLRQIARAQAAVGDLNAARLTVDGMETGIYQDEARRELIAEQALLEGRAGDVTTALRTARQVKDDYYYAMTVGRLACMQLLDGDPVGAEATVAMLSPGENRTEGNISLAQSLLFEPSKPARP